MLASALNLNLKVFDGLIAALNLVAKFISFGLELLDRTVAVVDNVE